MMKHSYLVASCLGIVLVPMLGHAEYSCTATETANSVASGVNLTGKVAVVTGGDSGIGFATAEMMARHGATVVIAGHNATTSERAARNLSHATGADVRSMPFDLASFKSVRGFADLFLKEFGHRLHFLINDAGMSVHSHDSLTEDGFELMFQTNYLGHFLLTELLLPALRESRPSRVVNVASEMHRFACSQSGFSNIWNPFPQCFKDFAHLPPPVSMTPSNTWYYGLSKFLMIQHAAELAKREASAGVTAFSVCPGIVDTNMTRHEANTFKWCWLPGLQQPCPYTAAQGAAVIAYCALGDAEPGGWYQRRKSCTEGEVTMSGFTESMRPALYRRSQQWAGLESLQHASGDELFVTV